jgi:hypothetical protein
VEPIAVLTDANLYLVVSSNIVPDGISMPCGIHTIQATEFVVAPLTHSRLVELVENVKLKFLQKLRARFSEWPLYAELEVSLPDEFLMMRNYKQNVLLDNKYEQSGYMLRVYRGPKWGREDIAQIDLFIRFSVLTANHPRNRFYDPTEQEFNKYKEAVAKAKSDAQHETCREFKGEFREGICVIRSN